VQDAYSNLRAQKPMPKVLDPSRRFRFLRRLAGDGIAYLSSSVPAIWTTALAFVAILIFGWLDIKASTEQQLSEHAIAMAQLAADRVALTFDTIGKTLQAIGDGIGALEQRQRLEATLARARERTPGLVSLALLDPAGHTLVASPADAADTAATPYQRDIPPLSRNAPAVSAPFRDSASGIWMIRMAHHIVGANGQMSRTLLAYIAIDKELGRVFAQYPIAEGDIVALYDSANRQLAVFPPPNRSETRRLEDIGAIPPTLTEKLDQSVRYTTPREGNGVRMVATRKSPRYPFYVSYGQNVDMWLIEWRLARFVLAFAALTALLVAIAISTGIKRRLALTEQLREVRGELEESNVTLRATLTAAEKLAARDQLTGLCNRSNFDQRLESTIARATRHGHGFSLLMLDIDHLKNVNDYYGLATGDDVLRRFGEVLRERLRQNDVAARWGGEEFVVLADGANLDNARTLAEQIRESIASTMFSPVPRITVSIGIADFVPGESGDDLLRRAEKALYGAKRNGRNRVIAAENGKTGPLRRQSA
jgi:diguanylate cyclase (GGDEF)-like protein